MAVLNLGSGSSCLDEWVNLDRVDSPGVDVVWDVDLYPWPFSPGEFNEVRACQLFEHVIDPVGFMAEAWRVLTLGGLLIIVTPHWQSENSYTDPTHIRHCTERTWDYWCEGTALRTQFGPAYGDGFSFDREMVCRSGDDIHAHLRKRG